jgi:cysteine desulfurase
MINGIYLDHASTTHLDHRVHEYVKEYLDKHYGNPGSLHELGLKAKSATDEARKKIAKVLHCKENEIVFTSGGTESVNLAIKGIAFSKEKGHIITSKIEHPAVLETCRYLEKKGFSVTYLNVDKYGLVKPSDVKKAIRKDTILITIMYANNEVGTIEPITEIGKIAKKNKIIFHTDACQAAGVLNLNVNALHVNLMTINGSKIYGPKGSGMIYIKKGTKLEPLIHGGGQELGLRSGTENVPAIVGLAEALKIADKEKNKEKTRLTRLRNYFIRNVKKKITKTKLNGHPTKRLPNNVNISFLDVEGESLLLYLDNENIYVSTGSACSSNKLEVSHVLDAMGIKHEIAHGSIRFTLGRNTTKKDIDEVLKVLPNIVKSLRRISPLKIKK